MTTSDLESLTLEKSKSSTRLLNSEPIVFKSSSAGVSSVTDTKGRFVFTKLPAGNYTLVVFKFEYGLNVLNNMIQKGLEIYESDELNIISKKLRAKNKEASILALQIIDKKNIKPF